MTSSARKLAILFGFISCVQFAHAQGITINRTNIPPNGEVNVLYNQDSGFQFTSSGAPVQQWYEIDGSGSNLPPGLTLQNGIISGTPVLAGTYTFTIGVQGQCSCNVPPTDQANFTIQVFAPLQITNSPTLSTGLTGSSYLYSFTAQGGDPANYQWSIFTDYARTGKPLARQAQLAPRDQCYAGFGVPPGLCLTTSGVLQGVPTTPGNYQFRVQLYDADIGNYYYQSVSMSVVPGGSNALTLSGPVNLGTVLLGNAVSGALNATGGSAPYTFTITGLPAGMTSSGAGISGTPSAPGNYSAVVKVTDSVGTSAISSINFSVFGIATQSLPADVVASSYQFTITAAGGATPYSFAATGLPPNFSLSSYGVLTGTATAAGSYKIAVTAQDANGLKASATLQFWVNTPGPLIVPGGDLTDTTVQLPTSQSLSATGGAPSYNWSIAGGTFPDGLTLHSSGAITGTPAKAGSYTFSARATDVTGASGVGTYTINVKAQQLTILTPSPLSVGMINVDYPEQVLTASGGSGIYKFAVTTSALPAGLTMDPNGAISGTPTVVGDFVFTVTVTDSNGGQTGAAQFEIKVRPYAPDLMLSAGSLAFYIAAGSAAVPPIEAVQVESTDVTKLLNYSVTVTGSPAWLSVAGAGTATASTTPGAFRVSLTPAALALAASTTPYSAQIIVTCVSPSPCAGNAQPVSILLNVKSLPPIFTVINDLLSFTTTPANPQATTQAIEVENTGGGSIGFQSISCSASWCHVGSAPSGIGGGVTGDVFITADPSGLKPGFYYADVTMVSSVGTNTVPVSFFIAQNATLAVDPAGTELTMQAGGQVAVPESSINVSVSGTTPVAWTATLLPGAPWVNLLTPNGTSTGTAPGVFSFSVDQSQVAALAAGTYYATIRVTAPTTVDSPQDFQIVLNVLANDKTKPQPTPGGLLFITTAAGTPPPQTDVVFASSVDPVFYQATATTEDGNNWLKVAKTTGSTSTSTPAQASISVAPAGLNPGVYHGTVTYSFSASGVRSVNVTLIVLAPGLGSSARSGLSAKAQALCTPAKLVLTQTGLVSNFAAPASWPTPLEITMTDDCGNNVGAGQVVATFSNGDPPLVFSVSNAGNGVYSGTWTPRHTGSQVTVNAHGTAAGLADGTTQIAGSVVPNVAPVLTPQGTLHVFTPQVGAPLAPGTIVQIYGSQLANSTQINTAIPLPTSLAGTSVVIGGVQAPLYFVSSGQINAQLPFELSPGQPYQIIVNNNGALSTPNTIAVANVTPGVAALPSGVANAQHVADASLITSASPAKPGEYIVLYLAGMGATSVPVEAGAAAPSSPLATTTVTPTATLNNEPVNILFSGMTPGLAGLYQIDLQVPADAPNGDLNLVISQPGSNDSAVILPVHN